MAPPVVLYVAVAAATVAATIAFKQFVYEPHIAPKIEQWAEEFVAKRRERRRQQELARNPVAVPQDEDESRGLGSGPDGSSLEMDHLVFHEMQEDGGISQAYLRRRQSRNPRLLDESDPHIAFDPMSPEVTTHVIYDNGSSLSTSPSGSMRATPPRVRMPLQPGYPSPRPSPLSSRAPSLSLASEARQGAHGVMPDIDAVSSASSLSLSPNMENSHIFSYPTSPFSDAAAIPALSPVPNNANLRAPAGSLSDRTEFASAHSDFGDAAAWSQAAMSPSRAASVTSPFSLRDSDEDFEFGSSGGLSDDESWASASVASRR